MATFRKKLATVIFVVAILAIGGFWYWKANKEEPFVPRDLNTVASELKDSKKFEKYVNQLTEAYKKDFDGGSTPEETLNLFISALKAGDTDLAAKYFLLEKQAEMKEKFQKGKISGGVQTLLTALEKEKISSGSAKQHTFTTFDEDNNAEFSFDLILNPYTHKWKIESL